MSDVNSIKCPECFGNVIDGVCQSCHKPVPAVQTNEKDNDNITVTKTMSNKKGKKSKDNIINIRSYPVQARIGASKYVNDDWTTIAFFIPRDQLQLKFADEELRYNCIYFLFGYEKDIEKCYVGQAKIRNNGESALARLREHDKGDEDKWWRHIWKWAIVVTNKDNSWTPSDLNALESAFYAEIPVEQNLNGNNPNSGGADFELYENKIEQIKSFVTAISFNIFKDKAETESIQITSETNEFSTVEDLQNGMARIPEIVTPPKVVKNMVDILPEDVWNDKTIFLDPACKGGEFLREIYDRLMENEVMQSKYKNDIERSNHILSEQLYGIALSQVSLERTKTKLMGFGINIRIIPNYIERLKNLSNSGASNADKRKYLIDILNKEFGKDMKIDIVIGNPPYQENNSQNGRQTKSLYDKFIEMGIEIADRAEILVTNNTFLTNESKIETRNIMIDNGLKILYNYTKSGELFKGVGVSACIFDVDKSNIDHNFEYIRIENGKELSRYKTILSHGDIIADSKFDIIIHKKCVDEHNMGEIVLGAKTFGLATNGRIGFTGVGRFIKYSLKPFENSITLKNKSIANGCDVYVSRKDIPCGDKYIDMYKVMCPLIITKNNLNTFNKATIFPSGYASTDGWTILGASNSEQIAKNLMKYIETKTFKINVRAFCSDGMTGITKVLMSHVPLPNLAEDSDIDWSQSIADIDRQLYKKYRLSEEEIDYIEKTINTME